MLTRGGDGVSLGASPPPPLRTIHLKLAHAWSGSTLNPCGKLPGPSPVETIVYGGPPPKKVGVYNIQSRLSVPNVATKYNSSGVPSKRAASLQLDIAIPSSGMFSLHLLSFANGAGPL